MIFFTSIIVSHCRLDLESGKPTKSNVSRAIRAVAKWKECAEFFNTAENIEKSEEMLASLNAVLEGLGAKIEKPVERKGTKLLSSHAFPPNDCHTVVCKVSTIDLKNLATEEDVTDIFNLYHEYFEKDADEDEPPITGEAADALGTPQKLNNCGGDFGMELEATMTPTALASSLGFKGGLPPLFNNLRHRSGISPWDDPTAFIDPTPKPLPDHLSKMGLHWHQLAGVHSIVRSIFTQRPDAQHTRGVLVGDEVGLGKTAQGIAFIAFLIQAIWAQQSHRNPSPILGEGYFHETLFLLLNHLSYFRFLFI